MDGDRAMEMMGSLVDDWAFHRDVWRETGEAVSRRGKSVAREMVALAWQHVGSWFACAPKHKEA